MKCRKIMAVLVSAVLLLSLLAGCAKGGAESTSELDLTKVNAIVQENGCETRVTASGALKRAVNEAAALVAAYDAGEVKEGVIQNYVAQRLDAWNKTVGVSPWLVTEEELQTGVASTCLGVISTPEEMVADVVLAMDQILKQVRYEAAAAQTVTKDGVTGWVVVVIYYL